MNTPLIIGCPVWKREWIMPAWFEHVERAAQNAAVVPHYVFVTDQYKDTTVGVLMDEASRRHRNVDIVHFEQADREDKRDWPRKGRLELMVDLRNALLARVREYEPGFFLSLDSDILLHPDAISSMLEETHRFDAVGGKCYMGHVGTRLPSCANLDVNGGMKNRSDADGAAYPKHVIMAIKLMLPQAYRIDYEYSSKGEDIGWSIAARRAGLSLGWDAKVCSKHVMTREQLTKIDPRCGF